MNATILDNERSIASIWIRLTMWTLGAYSLIYLLALVLLFVRVRHDQGERQTVLSILLGLQALHFLAVYLPSILISSLLASVWISLLDLQAYELVYTTVLVKIMLVQDAINTIAD